MNKKRMNRLVKLICEKESGKVSINAGQARELVKLMAGDAKIVSLLVLMWADQVEGLDESIQKKVRS